MLRIGLDMQLDCKSLLKTQSLHTEAIIENASLDQSLIAWRQAAKRQIVSSQCCEAQWANRYQDRRV